MEQSGNIMGDVLLTIGGAEITTLEFVIALAVLGAVIAYFRRDAFQRANRDADEAGLREAVARVAEAQAGLDAQVRALASGAAQSQETLRRAVDDRLDSVAKRMGDGLTETQRRTGEALGRLHERLALIDRAQENIKALTGEVSGLQSLLANKQRRGAFGEIQMQDLVKTFLPSTSYSFQTTLSNRARVDCLILLPDPPGSVAVDAKFPLESWRALSEADDDGVRETAARAFRTDMLKHVADIASKYLIPGETADTALMFVPSEAVYACVHADFPDVVEKSFKKRVMIVSPTTFMATLHTMRALMRDARMREQAGVIQREVGLLSEDVQRLDGRVANLQRHFDQAGEDVRQIRISADKVVRRAERIEEAPVDAVEDSGGEGQEAARLTAAS